jgi:phosphotriesterase-related protein
MDDDKLLEFSDLGGYCQYDFFGLECSHFQMNQKIDMPSDAQRIGKLNLLKEHGKLERTLMSHDIHTKHRLVSSYCPSRDVDCLVSRSLLFSILTHTD